MKNVSPGQEAYGRTVPPPATAALIRFRTFSWATMLVLPPVLPPRPLVRGTTVRPGRAGRGERLVSAGVILIRLGVDDEMNRLVGDAADGGENIC